MMKYMLAAASLKMFSMNGATQTAYRRIGNVIGQRIRKDQDLGVYIRRGDLLVSLCRKYGVLQDGNRFLELGTGWIHWFGLYARLHAELHVDLFDVWDNRQFKALTSAMVNLRQQWEKDSRLTARQAVLLEQLMGMQSLEELYELLDMKYTIDRSGSLSAYQDNHYDCVFSFHVLEHVRKESLLGTISDVSRILKKGGYSIHQVGIDDHLSHYDRKASPKNYLRYSRRTWKRFLENTVQHINTLQASDFLDICGKAGLESLEVIRKCCNIEQVPVHDEWRRYSQDDLETTILTIVHRKPE